MKILLTALLMTGFVWTSAFSLPPSDSAASVTFAAMGDIPYAESQYGLLVQHIEKIDPKCAFVVHLGDIKPGKDPCHVDIYKRVAGILRQCGQPVFIVPGDNEYNDCAKPDQAWQYWVASFMRFDTNWAKPVAIVHRQPKRPEHFSFVRDGVLFVGVHVVGGRVHDADEWKQRMGDAVTWLDQQIEENGKDVRAAVVLGHATPTKNQALFFEGLTKTAKRWKKPMLYLHGDGHKWKRDRPFKAKNVLRVQVDAGGKAPPVRVTVTTDADNPFEFDRGSVAKKSDKER